MISAGSVAFFTIINRPLCSISAERWLIDAAIKASSNVWDSYFSWSFTTTPMILDEFCASRIPAILGIYCRFSKSACTRRTVSSDIFLVLPCSTLETVAVLSPILLRCPEFLHDVVPLNFPHFERSTINQYSIPDCVGQVCKKVSGRWSSSS